MGVSIYNFKVTLYPIKKKMGIEIFLLQRMVSFKCSDPNIPLLVYIKKIMHYDYIIFTLKLVIR